MGLNKTIAIVVLLFGLLAGGLVAGIFLSQRPTFVNAAPAVQQQATPSCTDDDNIQDENKNEADDGQKKAGCDQNEVDTAGEANKADGANDNNGADQADKADDNSASLQGQTGITADQAKATAAAANPGAKALTVELDRADENGGAVIYQVELDNGLDVTLDAANGKILKTEKRDAN